MLVGKQIGPFKVEKELGSGAMGSVYRGVETKTGRLVAIKIISLGLSSNDTAIERFLRESSVLKKLNHPNIARYLGSGRLHGTPFYIMEYLEGESLDRVLQRRIRITWEELVDIGRQLCSGLQHAHENGVIHRDLKPSNLMILPGGVVKLTDFGIAKDLDATALTATHSTLGTAAYMSPEQCRGAKDITSKSDLYSMGVMFYELVTGRKPFTADNPMDVFMMHVKGKFARPSTFAMDIPISLDMLICQLMEKDPNDRPLNAAKVANELESVERRVVDQTSAGVERAAKRRADRTSLDRALDVTDKEAARVLLGKKKKRKTQPFYTENWFTLSALAGVALAAILFIYFTFLKAPGADELYLRADRLMLSTKPDDHKAAREPVNLFLFYYPNEVRAAKVKGWREQIERETTEYFISMNRRAPTDPSDGWDAIDIEKKSGPFDDAIKKWTAIVHLRNSSDPEQRGWGLIAELRLAEQTKVDELHGILESAVRNDPLGKSAAAQSPARKKAIEAMRLHFEADQAKAPDDHKARIRARSAWNDLERLTKDSDENRLYYLLAVKKLGTLQ